MKRLGFLNIAAVPLIVFLSFGSFSLHAQDNSGVVVAPPMPPPVPPTNPEDGQPHGGDDGVTRFPFSAYFHSPAINHETEANITVQAGDYASLDDAGRILKTYVDEHGKSYIPDGHQENMEVVVIVPKGAPKAYVEAFVAETRAKFATKFGAYTTVIVKESYIDVDLTQNVYAQSTGFLNEELAKNPAEDDRAMMLELQGQIRTEEKELAQWKKNWYSEPLNWVKNKPVRWLENGPMAWLNQRNPRNRDRAAVGVALIKIGISAHAIVSKWGYNAGSLLVASLASGAAAGFGYYAVEYSNWTTKHKLIYTKQFPWLERFPPFKWYNNSPIGKSIFINFVRSSVVSALLRGIAYKTHQHLWNGQRVGPPAGFEYWTDSILITGFELWGDAMADIGSRRLAQKGTITYAARSYAMWTIGLIDSTMHGAFRAGMNHTALTLCGASFILKTGVYALGKIFSPRDRRVVVMSGWLNDQPGDTPEERKAKALDRELVVKNYSLDEAIRPNPQTDSEIKIEIASTGKPMDVDDFAKRVNIGHLPLDRVQQVYDNYFKAGQSLAHSCRLILGGRK